MKLQATITKAELNPQTGYLSLLFDIAGNQARCGFWLSHRNNQEIQRGQEALSALLRLAGRIQIHDTSELIGLSIPVVVKEVTGRRCGSVLVVVDW